MLDPCPEVIQGGCDPARPLGGIVPSSQAKRGFGVRFVFESIAFFDGHHSALKLEAAQ